MNTDSNDSGTQLKDRTVALLLDDPSLKHGVDIPEDALCSSIDQEFHSQFAVRPEKEQLLKIFQELSQDGFICRTVKGTEILVRPAYRYYVLLNDESSASGAKDAATQSFQDPRRSLLRTLDSENDEIFGQMAEALHCEADELKALEILEYPGLLYLKTKCYTGDYKDVVLLAPFFSELLEALLTDRFTDWHVKVTISCALAYLMLKDDVIPDDDELGLVDDVFIMTYVLRKIKARFSPTLIEKHWHYNAYEENICDLIEGTYHICCSVVGDQAEEILQKVGLHKFDALELEEYSGSYQPRVARLSKEKRELLALLAFVIQKMDNVKTKGMNAEKLKDYVRKSANYDEIDRIIALSNLDHEIQELRKQSDSFEQDFEQKMNEAVLSVLLGRQSSGD
jgi:uncharacterized membrane protein YkvA (DUF1232 family)